MSTGCKSKPAQMAWESPGEGRHTATEFWAILMLLTARWQLDGEPYTHKTRPIFNWVSIGMVVCPDKPLGTHSFVRAQPISSIKALTALAMIGYRL